MRRALLTLALCLIATAAQAHDMWIEPSSFGPAPGARIGVRLRVGQQFDGDPLPRDPARIVHFDVITATTPAAPIPGVPGTDPAGILVLESAGLVELVYSSNPESIELEAPRFETYLHEEGLDQILARRAELHETGKPAKEQFSRCAKSLVMVGGVAGSGSDRVVGLPLEIVPERNPYTLAAGDALPVRLLFQGKPLAGAQVSAVQRGRFNERLAVRTDAHGRARLPLARGGVWLIKSVEMVAAPAGSGAEWRSYWASLTFELPAAPAVHPR